MKKYLAVFKISWSQELTYRFNFVMSRLRSIIILLLLYYVWTNLSSATGRFAGYTREELLTYVFGINILRAVIFGSSSRQMAAEINDGTFSVYLIKPVNHFWYIFFREFAQRSIYFLTAIIEVVVLVFILKVNLFWLSSGKLLLLFLISMVGSLFLYYLLSYLVGLLAFWSRESMGPRFLFDWILEFASGAYFPLDILSRGFFVFFSILPFAYLIYFPAIIYLARVDFLGAFKIIAMQILWIIILGLFVNFVWHKGLKKYTGEGI